MLPQARMATGVEGTWEMYVLVSAHEWSKFEFRRLVVPDLEERTAALASLGYAPAAGAEWEWRELPAPTGARIFASVPVRRMTPQERSQAFTASGVVFTARPEQGRAEHGERHDGGSSPVRTVVSFHVCSRDGGAS
ncbi:DUF6303 family protein [Streptomyces sp. NPDC002409]